MAALAAKYVLGVGKNLVKKHGNNIKAALTEKAKNVVNKAATSAGNAIKAKVGTLAANLHNPPNNRNRKPNNYKPLPVGNVRNRLNIGNSPPVM